LVKFHESLSEQTVYLRYFQALKLSQRVAHERLSRMCFIDYSRELALVVEHRDAQGQPAIIGVGRLTKLHGGTSEFALLVTDLYQRHGLGSELLSRLLHYARDEGLREVHGHILRDNTGMQRVVKKLGFESHRTEGGELKAVLKL
jgi:acetyltransferase